MRGSVTKKGSRWYIRYYTGKDAAGKWRQKWEGSWGSKRDAERVLRERIGEIESTYERKADSSTMAIYLRYWLNNYCVPRLKTNTVNGYRVNIEKHIIPYIGEKQLNRLKPNDIQKLYASLSAAGLGNTSIRYVHNNLHRALGYAVKQQLIVRNPADLVFAPTVAGYEAVTLTPTQAQTLLKYCEGKELFIPVLLGLALGLRRGEVLGLQWSDVEWDEHTLTIRHSLTYKKGGMELGSTKTKHSRRTLVLPDALYAALKVEQRRQEQQVASRGVTVNSAGFVCCRLDGTAYTSNALQHHFKDALKAAELPDIRFHDLRHTNATIMLRHAVPAKIVSSMLGHSTIGITLDTYSHVITEMQEGATGVMNELLGNL